MVTNNKKLKDWIDREENLYTCYGLSGKAAEVLWEMMQESRAFSIPVRLLISNTLKYYKNINFIPNIQIRRHFLTLIMLEADALAISITSHYTNDAGSFLRNVMKQMYKKKFRESKIMNKDDMEFFKLTESSKPTSGIILIDRKKYMKSRDSYAYDEFKSADLIDKITTCRVFNIQGLPYLLVYGSTKKEDSPRNSLKSVNNLIKQYKRQLDSLKKPDLDKQGFIIMEEYNYKGLKYDIGNNSKKQIIPIIKLFHQSERGFYTKPVAIEEALDQLINSLEVQAATIADPTAWKDFSGYDFKLKFLTNAKISYFYEGMSFYKKPVFIINIKGIRTSK